MCFVVLAYRSFVVSLCRIFLGRNLLFFALLLFLVSIHAQLVLCTSSYHVSYQINLRLNSEFVGGVVISGHKSYPLTAVSKLATKQDFFDKLGLLQKILNI